ncbi:hypothetical protein BCVP_CDS0218 [Bacillus phage BC-VP]|nr:hypothetical protein BCVP_CDS0218 [Bacillus phage BC-VP]
MAKKPFSWDTEELIKEFSTHEKIKHEVYKCTLAGSSYVVILTYKLTAEGWKFKKNNTMLKEVFDIAADAVAGSDIW